MSAKESLKVWLNQKIANILGDLQEQEPIEDPSPIRAVCRIFFMVSLLLGFSLMLGFTFFDAPDARVVQIYRLTPGDENHAFPSCFLYDRNSTSCKKWTKSNFPEGIPASCPCTNTSFSWKEFLKFYILHENSSDWNIKFTAPYDTYPRIIVPDDTIHLGNENIVRDDGNFTAEKFCDLSYLWPLAEELSGTVRYEVKNIRDDLTFTTICEWMATLLFQNPSKEYEDTARSTRLLNTQNLLNREEFNTLLAKLARDSVLKRRLTLEAALPLDAGDGTFRSSYNALARQLTGLVDREEMDPSRSYTYGAQKIYSILDSNQVYDPYTMVWYLEDDSGPIFLHTEIKWEAYRQACSPELCEVTVPMRVAQRLFWSLGILGGVATIVLAVVTTLLWPCTAMLLLWISDRQTAAMLIILQWFLKRQTAEQEGPGTPHEALVAGPSLEN